MIVFGLPLTGIQALPSSWMRPLEFSSSLFDPQLFSPPYWPTVLTCEDGAVPCHKGRPDGEVAVGTVCMVLGLEAHVDQVSQLLRC